MRCLQCPPSTTLVRNLVQCALHSIWACIRCKRHRPELEESHGTSLLQEGTFSNPKANPCHATLSHRCTTWLPGCAPDTLLLHVFYASPHPHSLVWKISVHVEGGNNGSRVGQPGGLNDNVVKLVAAGMLRSRGDQQWLSHSTLAAQPRTEVQQRRKAQHAAALPLASAVPIKIC